MIKQAFAASEGAILRAEAAAAEVTARAEREAQTQTNQSRVMKALSDGLGRLASGDLTARIESPANTPFPQDYEALRTDFNAVGGRLGESFAHVAESATQVRQIATEIGSFASALSSRTEAQAATLEESSAALTELSESVSSTARLAHEGNQQIVANQEAAQSNMAIVNESVEAIRRAEDEARKISQVIGVIDDIAFQTNLLALNAGVEAARAGEAGRGFAVVASEVRSLAERASASAREIRQMIVRSLDQVTTGSTLAQRSGESLESLVAGVQSMAGRVTEIANGAQEQARGLAEITSGISHLDRATQENAAIAEESQAAAESLRMAADQLVDALAGFRMSSHGGPRTGDNPASRETGRLPLRAAG
jgi:methyl-accepting chemotaxis protein